MLEHDSQRCPDYTAEAEGSVTLPAALFWCVLGMLLMLGLHALLTKPISYHAWAASLAGVHGAQVGPLLAGAGLWLALGWLVRWMANADQGSPAWRAAADATGVGRALTVGVGAVLPAVAAIGLLLGRFGTFELLLAAVVAAGIWASAKPLPRVLPQLGGGKPVVPEGTSDVPSETTEERSYRWLIQRTPYWPGLPEPREVTLRFTPRQVDAAREAAASLGDTPRDLAERLAWAFGSQPLAWLRKQVLEWQTQHGLSQTAAAEDVLAFCAALAGSDDPAVHAPQATLFDQAGNRDDLILLAAALLRVLGQRPLVLVLTQDEAAPRLLAVPVPDVLDVPLEMLRTFEGRRYRILEPVRRRGFWHHLPQGVALDDRPLAWARQGEERWVWQEYPLDPADLAQAAKIRTDDVSAVSLPTAEPEPEPEATDG